MNKRSKSRTYVIDFLILTIFISALILVFNSRSGLANLVSSIVFPGPSTVQPSFVVPSGASSPNGSATLLPTPVIVDLNPEIPFDSKTQVTIMHSNGIINVYLLKEGIASTFDDLRRIIPLSPDDKLLWWSLPPDSRDVPPPPPHGSPTFLTPAIPISPIVPTETETGLSNTVFPPKLTPIIEGTPQPTPITIDLAPDIPFNEKQQIGVEHRNGVYNIYLIKPGSATSLDELKKIIPFGPGDRLVYWGQPAFTYRTVPPPQIPTLTPILFP